MCICEYIFIQVLVLRIIINYRDIEGIATLVIKPNQR